VQHGSIYLSPGMFGFARIASFSYFEHVSVAIKERFAARGREVGVHVCDVHPTASIRRRASRLAQTIAQTVNPRGPIHLVGHSTGGLDARLIASPTVHLQDIRERELSWLPRLRSITTINTPHYGTPLAAFFATVSGQRLLYAVSALTVTGLKLGAPPLAATSALMAAFGKLGFGALEVELVEKTTESVIRVLDDASSRELRAFLRMLRDDQGALIQLMPEAMDLFLAGVENRKAVRYQSVATYAPQHTTVDWVGALSSPWDAISAGIFAMLYNITARQDPRYPCAPMDGSGPKLMRNMMGEVPPSSANDGVVPLYSQLWGDVVWVGKADHLDVVGHFRGERPKRRWRRKSEQNDDTAHNDWMRSGAGFNRVRFDTVMDRIVDGMLVAEEQEDLSE